MQRKICPTTKNRKDTRILASANIRVSFIGCHREEQFVLHRGEELLVSGLVRSVVRAEGEEIADLLVEDQAVCGTWIEQGAIWHRLATLFFSGCRIIRELIPKVTVEFSDDNGLLVLHAQTEVVDVASKLLTVDEH